MLQSLIKDTIKLDESNDEYQRLEYCLKVNLRLINGRFKDMKIHQINQSPLSHQERFHEKTQIEIMELVKPEQQEYYEALTKVRGKLNISKNNPKMFTYGTIVEDPKDIKDNSEYTFCVYRVGVGKSYCHKMEKDESVESITLKDGYDSVYIENPPN